MRCFFWGIGKLQDELEGEFLGSNCRWSEIIGV